MAKKHFDKYFMTVSKQYFELQEALKELSEEVNNNIVEPERLEQFKNTVAPIKNSYESLLYIKYLLDMPQRDSKKERYMKANKKAFQNSKENNGYRVVERNRNILNNLSL